MSDFMKTALAEAQIGIKNGHGGPFGAVVVLDGKIIGQGHNSVLLLNDPTAHAEIMAIRDACKNINSFNLSGADLYTTCYPCPMCAGAVQWARLDRIIYCLETADTLNIGFDDSLFYSQMLGADFGGISRKDNAFTAECLDLFAQWDNRADKNIKY